MTNEDWHKLTYMVPIIIFFCLLSVGAFGIGGVVDKGEAVSLILGTIIGSIVGAVIFAQKNI